MVRLIRHIKFLGFANVAFQRGDPRTLFANVGDIGRWIILPFNNLSGGFVPAFAQGFIFHLFIHGSLFPLGFVYQL
jgi:hypothetical protein